MSTEPNDKITPIFDVYLGINVGGLTKREFFAIEILKHSSVDPAAAVRIADKLIAELNK